VVGVGCDAAPCGSAVVGVVGARVCVAKFAARGPVDGAAPCSSDVVVGPDYDPVGVVGVYRDGRLVLWRAIEVLVDCHGRWLEGVTVERAGEEEGRRYWCAWGGVWGMIGCDLIGLEGVS